MVRAWYMDTSDEDQRLDHMTEPPQFLDIEDLKKNTGILYWKIENAEDYLNNTLLNDLKKGRGYTYEDAITITEQMPEYEKKIKIFFEEHLHADEEIRFILDGRGFFDARDHTDRWVRIEVMKGDLIILPAGIYHRFTTDKKDYIKAKRYFVGEPVWTPHNRAETETENHPARKSYLGGTKQ